MRILVKQFHYTGGFKPRSKIPTETWAMSMSLLKLLIQCQNHAGLATFKNPHQSAFDKHFKQFVESGSYKSSSCVLKQLTTHSNTSTLYFCREEMNPRQKNKKTCTYHRAAEGPEPPQKSQSQQQKENQESNEKDGPSQLQTKWLLLSYLHVSQGRSPEVTHLNWAKRARFPLTTRSWVDCSSTVIVRDTSVFGTTNLYLRLSCLWCVYVQLMYKFI